MQEAARGQAGCLVKTCLQGALSPPLVAGVRQHRRELTRRRPSQIALF